jgi:MFS family permease
VRWRLSLLMFLQYAVPGAWIPLFSLRLKELHFEPLDLGWACATQALASLVAPLAAGQVADRWLPAQRCVAGCALLAGLLLWRLAGLTSPAAVFWTSLVYWLVMVPVITLGTAICFTHLAAPERDFGHVRMWGTIGWVVPGLLLGLWFAEPDWLAGVRSWLHPGGAAADLADTFRLAGLLALVLAGYALTLPHTPPQRRAGSWLAPLAALHLLRQRAFGVYAAVALGLCVTIPFSSQVTPLLLEAHGIPKRWLSPTLTIAQSMEIASLALLPVLLLRLGVRGTMVVGLGAWASALALLTVGRPTWLVVSSLGLNGLCICCYIVAGQVFVNGRARGDIRASAQGLLTFVNGLGLLFGHVLVGWVREQAAEAFAPTFAVGAAIAAALVAVFLVGFTESEARRQ